MACFCVNCDCQQIGCKDTVEFPVFGYLVIAAFGLLAAVSGGIVYLTLAEWRDRRRRAQELQSTKPKGRR
jgi:hypothetical protein